MTVNFKETAANKGTLTFEIPAEDVKKGLDQAFKKVRKNISVPGFRKGKVPRQIFNNVYGEEALYDDTLNSLLPAAYSKAVEESGLDIVAQPEIDIESLEKGKAWVIKAEVTLKPEVKLGEYKNLSIEKESAEVTDEDVEEALESRRKNLAELVLKETAAEDGDTVVIDFEGFIDGEAFEGGKGENHSLVLGSGSFIPGFEEQLVGIEPNSELDVTVTFPEDYHAEELAGKEAVFKVKVHEVKTEELPELDDEFAKDADEEVESLDELKNKIRVQLEESKEQAAKDANDDKAIRLAVENAEFVGGVPEEMIDEEVERQVEYFLNNLTRQGINAELYYQMTGSTEEDLKAQFQEEAEVRTKTNLLLEEIAKQEAIEVTEDDIKEEVENLASQYGLDVERVQSFVTEDMLKSDVKLKKAMSLIVDTIE